MRTQFFRKIYLSLYWKGCVWEGVGDRTKTATYWPPPTLLAITAFLSHSPGLLTQGPGGSSLCWDMVLILASSLQFTRTSCHWGYIIIWHPPTSCKHHNFTFNSTPRQSRSPLISWYLLPDAPVIYTGAFLLLTAWPGSIYNTWNTIRIFFSFSELNNIYTYFIFITVNLVEVIYWF